MTSSNRKLIGVINLTARADAQDVEKYVAGLSVDRVNVHNMQRGEGEKPKPKNFTTRAVNRNVKVTTKYDLENNRVIVSHWPNAIYPGKQIDEAWSFIEEHGYVVTKYLGDSVEGRHRLYFAPKDEVTQ